MTNQDLYVELIKYEETRSQDYGITLLGTTASGEIAEIEVKAKELHPKWQRLSQSKIEDFISEINGLMSHKIPILSNPHQADYSGLRKILSI